MAMLPPTTGENTRALQPVGEVQSVQVDGNSFGGGLARGLGAGGDAVRGAMLVVQRRKERKAAEDAQGALSDYLGHMNGVYNGRQDEDTGEVVPGLVSRQLKAAEGSTADLKAAEKEWFQRDGGAYAKLSPEARALFEPQAVQYSSRFSGQAVRHELTQAQGQRKLERGVLAGRTAEAAMNGVESSYFPALAAEAAMRAGDAAVGEQVVFNGAGEREYASAEAKQAHELAAGDAMEKINLRKSRYFFDKAGEFEVEDLENQEAFIARGLEGVEELSPEAQVAVRDWEGDLRRSIKTQQKALAYDRHNAESEESRIEQDRLAELRQEQIAGGFQGAQGYVKALMDSPESKLANEYLGEYMNFQAALAKEQATAGKEAKKIEDDLQQRMSVAQLNIGAVLDDQGRVQPLSPQERRVTAMLAFTAGRISKPQLDEALIRAAEVEDRRLSEMSSGVLTRMMPDKVLALIRDDAGNFVVSDKRSSKGERLYEPDEKSGISRKWRNENAWLNKDTAETVYLQQVANVINTVKRRMLVDPQFSVQDGEALAENLLRGSLDDYNKVKLDEALMEENEMLNILQRNYDRIMLGGGK